MRALLDKLSALELYPYSLFLFLMMRETCGMFKDLLENGI